VDYPETFLHNGVLEFIKANHTRLRLWCYRQLAPDFDTARRAKAVEATLAYAHSCLELAETSGKTVVVGEFLIRDKILASDLNKGKAISSDRAELIATPGRGLSVTLADSEMEVLLDSPDLTHWQVDWQMRLAPWKPTRAELDAHLKRLLDRKGRLTLSNADLESSS
jgi:hypothetical protein